MRRRGALRRRLRAPGRRRYRTSDRHRAGCRGRQERQAGEVRRRRPGGAEVLRVRVRGVRRRRPGGGGD